MQHKNAKKASKGKLIGISYTASGGKRETVYASSYRDFGDFLSERRAIRRYAKNPRDIHEGAKRWK